jgi:hypothetical protein
MTYMKKLTANNPDAKKEMDLVRASVVQIGQLILNSPKVNGNDAKCKQIVDRAEQTGTSSASSWLDRHYLLDYFACTQQHRRK